LSHVKPAHAGRAHHLQHSYSIHGSRDMFKNILLATDGSAASDDAARLAVNLAAQARSRLTALYVINPYPYLGIGESSAVGFQAYMGHAYEHAAQAHAKIAALCEKAPGHIDLQLRRSEDASAAEDIVRTAAEEGADLIVVGSHGRTGVSRLMLGSVAAKVVAASSVPVLVARQQGSAE
jgi:nucleotide-binding universal stress UspA family protein